MRKMRRIGTDIVINVTSYRMLVNKWEYYITDDKHNEDIVRALVMGFETELGDISLSEITPYTMCQTNDLNEVLPAIGWEWVA